MKNALRLSFGVIVLAIIAFGFYLTGSPSENRLFREDELRVQDLRSLSSAINRYHRAEKKAPAALKSLIDECQGRHDYSCRRMQGLNVDDFEMTVKDDRSYELCTTFSRAAPFPAGQEREATNPSHHEAGRQCYPYKFPR